MNVYTLVLFFHILGAIGFFVALTFEGVVLLRLRSAQTMEQARFFIKAFYLLKFIYVPSFIGIIVGGLILAYYIGNETTLWIAVSLASIIIIMLLGGLVTGVKMGKLRKLVSGDTNSTLASIESELRDRQLVVSYCERFAIALGILFLMSTKPGLGISLVVIAVAAGFGLILYVWSARASIQCSNECVPLTKSKT